MNSFGHRLMAVLAILCTIVSTARADDPLARLDADRYGPGTLIAAMEQLATYRPPQAVDLLLPLLSHSEPDVARMAGWLLRKMGSAPAGLGAAGAVLADPQAEPVSRRSAALAVGELRDQGGISVLATALANDADEGVRSMAAQALGDLFRPGAAAALSQAARADESAEVRAAAVRALSQLPDADAQVVISVLKDQDPMVRLEAAWALGQESFRGSQGLLGNLQQAMQSDADCRVQAAAAWALGVIGDPSVKDALAAARNGPCRLTSQAAAWAQSVIK
ncbi:MAG TPA: HEAT repeat domain-containing protein [Myxococcota bacterium]|nr:HEAT repeat domain-containing protein [Myxococcota bacterium]